MIPRPAKTPRRRRLVGGSRAVALAAGLVLALGACSSAASPLPTMGPLPSAAATNNGTGAACPTSQPAALPAGETRTVVIETSKGAITLKIDGALSPIAAGNFVALAECGFYDGLVFHRVVPGFVIQGGAGPDGLAYSIQDEPVTATYRRGTLAMARTSQPNSQTSQYFIVLDDGAKAALASYNTYAIFGEVSAGMDAVDAIAAAADAELPTHPIAMDSVTVSNP
jgi:cyclophilin family peptidyl-prolyl cis-trans isomerase